MLYIYSKKNIKDFKLINDVEAGFKQLLLNGENFDDSISRNIMKHIDNVSLKKESYIETPFGGTSIDKLSTGCKAVLLSYYYRNDNNILINIIECGSNAILVLFELSYSVDMHVFCKESFLMFGQNAECIIDGVRVNSGLDAYERMSELNV